ncbi:lytic transglycosylase domain-containing protein [Pseudolabrys sp.]|uniref:lytic transglycosylase domain-containing protein n=1 Tax=Pseudolabrys sp. TaxID=1960880 RepID=UPI003D0F019A
MLATACAVMLASLMPAIELEDATPVDATETAARHDRSAVPEKNTNEKTPALRLASLSDGDRLLQDGAARDGANDAPESMRDEELEPETTRHAAPVPDARDLALPGLPSLDALDAAFDVPAFPTLAALDAAFDNRPIELPPVPIPSRRPPTYAEMCEALASAASAHSLPAPFLIRLIWQESRFRHNVISHAGAQGIAQFMPETANYMGLDDPFDPLEALPVSARFLRKLIERFGNLGLAAAAYNAGPKRVLDWLAGKGQLPQETQDYVKTITGQPAEKWRKPEATASLQRVPVRAPCQREAGLYAANGPDRIPLPPDRTPEKTVVAAADKKADGEKAGKKAKAAETKLAKAETKTESNKSEAGKSEAKSDAKPERKSIQLAAMSKAKADTRHDRKAAGRTRPAPNKPINLKPAAAKAQAQADAKSDSKSGRHAPKPAKKIAVAASR